MPNPEKVRRALGLPRENEEIDGFKVEQAKIGHIEVKRYRVYEYPISYFLSGNGDINTLKKKFSKGQSAIVKTSYGNPYLCKIESIRFHKQKNGVIVKGEGYCVRIYGDE